MGNVLTEGTTLKCGPAADKPPSHGGTLHKPGTPRLKVEHGAVLTVANLTDNSAQIVGCQNAGPGQVPCQTVTSVTGSATKLRVDGNFVLIDATLTTVTSGNPPGVLEVTDGVSKRLRAV